MARMQRLEMEYGAPGIRAREAALELQMRARVALHGAGTLLIAGAGVSCIPLLWYCDGCAPKERSGKLPSALALVLILGVVLLCASCASPVLSQTTLPGNSLAYRSTGTAREDNAWCLNENGFVGTYIRLAAAGDVSFTIRASKGSSKKEPPVLRLRVADLKASWPVTAAGDSYGSHMQTWTLSAGTYCVRVENTNDKPPGGPRAINIRDLTITGADVLNAPSDDNALAAADTYIGHFRRGPATLTLMRDGRALANSTVRARISKRIRYFVRDRARKYHELDVINEPVHCPVYHRLYGFEGVAGIYNEVKAAVREAGASTRLVPNEYEVLQGPRVSKDIYANWYRRHVEKLRNAGGAVDGIGIQYYVVAKRPGKKLATTHSPSRIAQVLHNLATTDLTLSMTEFGVQRFRYPTPERAAELLVEALRLCFGHEKMTTFINWGFYEPRMWPDAPKGALMDAKWKITPAGKAWQQLMGVRNWDIAGLPVWTTDVSLTTDARGRVNLVGFYGDYEIISGERRREFTLTKGTTDYAVVLKPGHNRKP